jgi:putative YhbY family RNA-binding protein
MAEISLTPKERQALKARAHALKPVVLLGAAGLTPAVIAEINRALAAHELIKIRVPGDDRAARESMWAALANTLSAARVQAIGKLLVLYRPALEAASNTEPTGKPKERRAPSNRAPTPGTKRRRDEVQKVRRPPAARRDPGSAHRAAGRKNAPKRGRR